MPPQNVTYQFGSFIARMIKSLLPWSFCSKTITLQTFISPFHYQYLSVAPHLKSFNFTSFCSFNCQCFTSILSCTPQTFSSIKFQCWRPLVFLLEICFINQYYSAIEIFFALSFLVNLTPQYQNSFMSTSLEHIFQMFFHLW